MRISDWSSDVCSSDLRVRQAFELGDDLLQPLLEIAAIARAREQRAHVERIDDRRQQHLGHVAQIGRASCRDRVCQYVSISVVAVSVKNNKQSIERDEKETSKNNLMS